MFEIRKLAIAFDEKELLDLERSITDSDEKEALKSLKKSVYDRLPSLSREGSSHTWIQEVTHVKNLGSSYDNPALYRKNKW